MLAAGVLLILRVPVLAVAVAVSALSVGVLAAQGAVTLTDAGAAFWRDLAGLAGPELALIPLVALFGNLALYSGLSTRIYDAAAVLMRGMPGGAVIAALLGCGGFAGLSGSSVACATTMGRICVPDMMQAGIRPGVAGASVAIGGTLGALIPPSVLLVLFGLLTGAPVAALFLAGIVPGVMSLAVMVAVALIWGRGGRAVSPAEPGARRHAIAAALPAVAVFALLIGLLTVGAGVAMLAGVALMAVIGVVQGRLPPERWGAVLMQSLRHSGIFLAVLLAARVMMTLIPMTGLFDLLPVGPGLWLMGVVVALLGLGMVMQPLAVLVLAMPFLATMIDAQGAAAVWLAVLTIKLLEIGLVTPPVGLAVFVVARAALPGRDGAIFAAVVPFLLADLAVLAALILFPALSLCLPQMMGM